MKRTNKKGFTLVELVIVIAIIAILAAVLIPTFSGVVEKANQSKALQSARNAFTALMAEENASLSVKTYDFAAENASDAYKAIKSETGVSSIQVTAVDSSNAATAMTIIVGSYTVTYNTSANPVWSATKTV